LDHKREEEAMSVVRSSAEKPARRAAPKAKVEIAAAPETDAGEKLHAETHAETAPTASEVPPVTALEQIMTAAKDFGHFLPNYEQVIAFHKGNFDAFVLTNTLLARGAQEISKEFFAQAQAQLETAATVGQAALQAKSLNDAVQLNVDSAKAGYEKFVAGSTKLGELSVKVATEAFAPVAARLNLAVETFTKVPVQPTGAA
jgi:phasin family protein